MKEKTRFEPLQCVFYWPRFDYLFSISKMYTFFRIWIVSMISAPYGFLMQKENRSQNKCKVIEYAFECGWDAIYEY